MKPRRRHLNAFKLLSCRRRYLKTKGNIIHNEQLYLFPQYFQLNLNMKVSIIVNFYIFQCPLQQNCCMWERVIHSITTNALGKTNIFLK